MLHIRNLPYETTEEELRELCAPFGRLVQSKLNVGANKNQAFVEFPDQTSAINMVSYFASSADPAKVHPCYIAVTSCALASSMMQAATPCTGINDRMLTFSQAQQAILDNTVV